VGAESLVVLCTCPDEVTAQRLARSLVEEGLAACVNAIPNIASTFRWEDKVQEDREVLLLIKSSSAIYARLEARIQALHPYELPEIVAVPIVRGSAAYLDWLEAAVSRVSE
jgi:periplasmic divalent cation tolerance protein